MARLKNPEPLSADVQRTFEQTRAERNLRVLTDEESGTGVDGLPDGVYGFTYSPALENFPLFKERDLRCYEGHKLSNGTVALLGFLTEEEMQLFETATEGTTIHLFAEPQGDAVRFVSIAMARVEGHTEYSQRGANGLELHVTPA